MLLPKKFLIVFSPVSPGTHRYIGHSIVPKKFLIVFSPASPGIHRYIGHSIEGVHYTHPILYPIYVSIPVDARLNTIKNILGSICVVLYMIKLYMQWVYGEHSKCSD